MSRINVVPPSELSNAHLLGEYHELPRICNLVRKAIYRGERPHVENYPPTYRLGRGHVRFFYPRLGYIVKRWDKIVSECKKRGMAVKYNTLPLDGIDQEWFNDWEPDDYDIEINKGRITTSEKKMKYSKYFKSVRMKTVFALLHASGQVRDEMLGITDDLKKDVDMAKSWRDEMLQLISNDPYTEDIQKAREAIHGLYEQFCALASNNEQFQPQE